MRELVSLGIVQTWMSDAPWQLEPLVGLAVSPDGEPHSVSAFTTRAL
jgi:hypothetical protein